MFRLFDPTQPGLQKNEEKPDIHAVPDSQNMTSFDLSAVSTTLDELSPWTELAVNLSPGAQDDIAKRYIMESKHRVHQQTLAQQDDNIELF